MINKTAILILVILFALMGCKQNQPKKILSSKDVRQRLETANKALVEKDRERIEAYISRHNILGMEENLAGLFFLVWGEPTGPKTKTGDIVVLDYKVSLIDGTICYDSKDGKKEFLVGQGGVESGLEMAVIMMQQGQKGKFILPPHLGHGLLGDNNKIPPLAILVFDIELLNVIEY